MKNNVKVKKQEFFEALTELNWLDVKLFKLGTYLGDSNATRPEIARLLHPGPFAPAGPFPTTTRDGRGLWQ